jgi:hypothetical protein
VRLPVALAAGFAAFLLAGQEAKAAGTARLDVFPDRPREGERATLQLRTFWTYADRMPPAIFEADYPMVVAAFAPNGRRVEIRLVRDPDDPYVWRATLRFHVRGTWRVCGANWQFSLSSSCPRTNPTRRRVQVRARNASIDAWHRLQRPMKVPSVADGAACPTSAANGSLSRIGFTGIAWGPGPAYPVLAPDRPVLRYLDPIPPQSLIFGSAWFGNKVLWAVDRASYRGPILIRGRQLDGPNKVRFGPASVPAPELRLRPTGTGYPSFTRVRAPGCYAYQVDGLGFSYTIVFEARPI